MLPAKFLLECEESDGMFEFYFSHDGNWLEGGRNINAEEMTKFVCWERCAENSECVAFAWYFNKYQEWGRCTHYYEKTELLSGNQNNESSSKAFIKCSGMMIIENIVFHFLIIL